MLYFNTNVGATLSKKRWEWVSLRRFHCFLGASRHA